MAVSQITFFALHTQSFYILCVKNIVLVVGIFSEVLHISHHFLKALSGLRQVIVATCANNWLYIKMDDMQAAQSGAKTYWWPIAV